MGDKVEEADVSAGKGFVVILTIRMQSFKVIVSFYSVFNDTDFKTWNSPDKLFIFDSIRTSQIYFIIIKS